MEKPRTELEREKLSLEETARYSAIERRSDMPRARYRDSVVLDYVRRVESGKKH